MRVADLKISIRLMLGFALMGLLILALGAVTLIKSASIHGSFTQVTDETIPNVEKLNTLVAELGQAGFAIRDAALIREAAQVEEGQELDERDRRIRAAHEKIQQTLKQLGETIHDPRALQLLERIKAGGTTYVEAEQTFMSQVQLALPTAEIATYLFNTVRPALDAYLAPVQELLQLQTELRDQAVQAARADMRALSVAVWVSGLLALVAGALLAWWIIRAITAPLQRAVQVSRAVAGGRLTDQIEPQGNNETGLLLNAQRDMIEQLRDVVTRVRQGSESVATASGQITQANLDLSSRTEEQASALQQTAASMEQLSSTVQQNANSAQQANQLAQSATQVAGRGGAAVDEVVHTMRGIQESSQRIADIIGVIDGIAFQTNILALNAAVEAARAGEQGRGFAVVAGEVRVLAQRSAEAAKEIKQLIDTSVQRVAAGTAQVDRAGETMKEVVQSIQQVTDLMGEISTASQEQSQGVTQVGEAITQMDQITQQNAALVEEMTASAHSLQGQAHELVQSVTVFTLGGEDQTIPDSIPPSGDAPQAALESAPAQRPGKSRLRLTAT